ncbi:DUF3168 domain-containing protein [Alphaproteobacteria bacterium KMM 3653]|uniref:DUF3168 domain-containing protein n=1 Tax=Harenicola maris TaxID=2841044 RepID=A0AAP2CPW7_9RHOB|nr:DUF3168 domain-containing protein [Harenicola maris]
MSYASSAALQGAIYTALQGDAGVAAHLAGAIYDAAPVGAVPELYAVVGDEEARSARDASGFVLRYTLTISVLAEAAGFSAAKAAAGAICAALEGADLALSSGTLIDLTFQRAKAQRHTDGTQRRIDLRFLARVDHSE